MTAVYDLIESFVEDWRGAWVSLALGIILLFGFSQGWIAPIFGYADTVSPAAGIIIRNIYYPFYLCGLGMLSLCYWRVLIAIISTPVFVGLIMLTFVSALWSIDPSGTLRRCVAGFMTCLIGYVLASRFSWARLTEMAAVTFLIMMVLSSLMAIGFHDKGRMVALFSGAWRGIWIEKNTLGAMMSLGFITCMAAALHNEARRIFWFSCAGLAVGLVILSTSKTALVAMILGGGALGFIFLARRGPMIGIVMMWLAVSGLGLLTTLIIFDSEQILGLLGKDATLTGRTNIWDGIMRQIQTRPWTGFGYGVVWTTEGEWAPLQKISNVAGFRAYHAHSAWLEIWLGLGVGGLILWGLTLVEAWLRAFWRSYIGDGGYLALPFLTIFSMSSLTESAALSWNDMRWCLFVMVLVKLALPDDVDYPPAGTGNRN